MKNVMKKDGVKLALLVMATGMALFSARGAWPYEQVDRVDLDPLGRIVSGWKAAPTVKPHRVLLFSECFGYNHKGGRCYGDWTFKKAGEISGAWTVVQEKDVRKLADAAYLASFDAIVFNNSSGVTEAMAPGLADALTGFVKGGKGIALIHSGLDAFKDSDLILDMAGGYFRGHPWHEDGTWKFLNEAGAHPVNASFRDNGVTFFKQDEIYQFPAFFSRKGCKVLISMDLADPATKEAELWWHKTFGEDSTRADHDYAVSWVKNYGKGRVFCTSFGHGRSAFLDPERLYHMFNGLQYVLKDTDEGTDKALLRGPDIPAMKEDWSDGPYYERMNKVAKSLDGKELDFVFFGDSITDGWNYPAKHKYSGGKEVWERRWGKLATANFGVSGDRTENVLWRITKTPQGKGWKAKTIFLMIGINNAHQVRRGWEKPDTPESAARGFSAVVKALRAQHPEARLVTFGCLPTSTRKDSWVDDYNRLIGGISAELGAEFHDIGDTLRTDGKFDESLTNDGLHPNGVAYERIGAEIDEILGRRRGSL